MRLIDFYSGLDTGRELIMFILKVVLRMAITGLIFLVIVLVYWKIVGKIMKIMERLKHG